MDVSDGLLERVPVGNLRVSRAEFGAQWAAAERLDQEQGARGVTDWYAAGVAVTCRWLAGVTTTGARYYAPATYRGGRAYEELIDAECLAVERLLDAAPPPAVLARRPGWLEAISATLNWAWRRQGPPPLQVDLRLTV